MENTAENKSKFFAQYYFQWVLHLTSMPKGLPIRVRPDCNEDDFFLLLKPLDLLTDDEYFELAGDDLGDALGDNKDRERIIKHAKKIIEYNEVLRTIRWEHYQYLQSKGYAVPFMGLSVEQLVEYGWVKLIKK